MAHSLAAILLLNCKTGLMNSLRKELHLSSNLATPTVADFESFIRRVAFLVCVHN
ncbi:unnamed protein product [Sphenostylis stenocarpa]|uniref:Uncharacterized protein n=1 Tax=Sphenostylis stenocarpa TaxID=92480 RepID=A0AA86VRH6_9FABA|nr:unnamed protein product [Sphenostylis stenocarpa]